MRGSPLRLGLIGAGHWGKVYIKTLERLPGFSLARLASNNPESRNLVHEGCQISKNWQEVTSADDLDGVIIAAPPKMHAQMIRSAIAASNPILVEKPLTLNFDEARALLDVAEQQRAIVHVDHIHLYHPAFRAMKNLGKALGPVQAIHSVAGDWGPFRHDTSVLWDRGSHDIAMCIEFLGQEPSKVSARVDENQFTENGPGENISVTLTFPRGVKANLEISNLFKEKKRSFAVQYEEQTLIYDDIAKVALSRRLKTGAVEAIDILTLLPLDQVLMDFATAIRRGKLDLDGLRLGIKVVNTLDLCDKSA